MNIGDDDPKLMGRSFSPDPLAESRSASPDHMTINVDDERTDRDSATEKAEFLVQQKQEDQERHAQHATQNAPTSYIDLSSGAEEEGEVYENATESEAGDAMMDYSSSVGFNKEAIRPQPDVKFTRSLGSGQVLNDLSPEALNKQLRYFHIGKLPEEVDLCLPVKCLLCAEVGHDADNCTQSTCSHCGAFNKHMTVLCPMKAKCPKCRESGHQEASCPYKLKTLTLDEILCDLCDRSGHVEECCELIWRTSGKPWDLDFSFPYIQLYCYECGKGGHLGNDCLTRRPGKGLGTSTWSAYQNFDVPTHSESAREPAGPSSRPKRQPTGHRRGKGQAGPTGLAPRGPREPRGPTVGEQYMMDRKNKSDLGLKIRGLALNQQPGESGDDFSDQGSFLHPKKLPEPPRKGKIQINAGMSHRFDEPPTTNFVSINRPFGDYGSAQRPAMPGSYPEFSNPPQGGEAGLARYNHGNPMNDGNYGGRDKRRSRSPPAMPRQGDWRGDRYEPGPPPPTREYRNENVYRPMPSAAHNAYNRHRM